MFGLKKFGYCTPNVARTCEFVFAKTGYRIEEFIKGYIDLDYNEVYHYCVEATVSGKNHGFAVPLQVAEDNLLFDIHPFEVIET